MIRLLERRKHDRLRSLLSSYIDGEVSETESREVEQHLARCSECAAELESLRSTSNLLKRLPQLQTPRSFALREAPEPARRSSPMMWTTSLATSVAALLLVVLLMGDLLGFITQSETTSQPFIAMEGQSAAQPAPEASTRSLPQQPSAPAAPPAPAPAQPQQPAAAMPQAPAPAQASPEPTPQAESQEPFGVAAAPAPPTETTPRPTDQGPMIATTQDMADAGYGSETPEPEQDIAAAETAPSPSATSIPAQERMTMPGPAATPAPEADTGAGRPSEESTANGEMEPFSSARDELPPQETGTAEPSTGVELPLLQLQIGVGALLGVLIIVTAWTVWRRAG